MLFSLLPILKRAPQKVKELSQLLPLGFHYITFRIKCLWHQMSYLRCTIRWAGKPIQNVSLPLAYHPAAFISRHFMLLRAVISFSKNCFSDTARGLPHYNSCLIDSPSASHSSAFNSSKLASRFLFLRSYLWKSLWILTGAKSFKEKKKSRFGFWFFL